MNTHLNKQKLLSDVIELMSVLDNNPSDFGAVRQIHRKLERVVSEVNTIERYLKKQK